MPTGSDSSMLPKGDGGFAVQLPHRITAAQIQAFLKNAAKSAAKWGAILGAFYGINNHEDLAKRFKGAPTVVEADQCCADTLLVPIVSDLRQQMDKLIAMTIRTQIMLADMPQHENRRRQFRIIDSLRQEEKRIRRELEERQSRSEGDSAQAIVGRSVRHPDRL